MPNFHSCFTALPPTGRCGTKSVLSLWGPAQKASKSTLLCPGVLLPCNDWHRQESGKGPHHSGFTEVRRKQLLTVLASASYEPPSHSQANRLSWQWRSSYGALPHTHRLVEVGCGLWRRAQSPAQARMLESHLIKFLNSSEDGGSTDSLHSFLQHN